MAQIVLIILGIVAIIKGLSAIFKGSVQLTREKTLTGPQARTAGAIAVAGGIVTLLFALVGISLMSR